MATFKDKSGREWQLSLDAPKIMRIREECDPRFLLNDGDQENTFDRLDADPVLLCRVVFLLCSEGREKWNVSEEQFYGEVLGDGDAIDLAVEAMLQAILSFSRGRTRTVLATLAQKQQKVQRLLTEKVLTKINDPELEERIVAEAEARIDEVLGSRLTPPGSATSSPEPSE